MFPFMPIFRRKNKFVCFFLHNFPLLELPLPIPTILNSEDPGKTKACNHKARISFVIQHIALVFIHKRVVCFPVVLFVCVWCVSVCV